MSEKRDGLMLSEAIEWMRDAIQRRDLPDEYLREHGNDDWTREDCFAGEWKYGITMVPCTFAIQLAEKVIASEGDQFIPFDK